MMYIVEVTEGPICIGHQLALPYQSKCNSLHGHNYTIKVAVSVNQENYLNPSHMVVDFSEIKKVLRKYDHTFLGRMHALDSLADFLSRRFGLQFTEDEFLSTFSEHTPVMAHVEPSTAENFAVVLLRELQCAVEANNPYAVVESVQLWETPGNSVTVLR